MSIEQTKKSKLFPICVSWDTAHKKNGRNEELKERERESQLALCTNKQCWLNYKELIHGNNRPTQNWQSIPIHRSPSLILYKDKKTSRNLEIPNVLISLFFSYRLLSGFLKLAAILCPIPLSVFIDIVRVTDHVYNGKHNLNNRMNVQESWQLFVWKDNYTQPKIR